MTNQIAEEMIALKNRDDRQYASRSEAAHSLLRRCDGRRPQTG
jgi:hypothetical protein